MASDQFVEIEQHVANIRQIYIGENKTFSPRFDLAKELNQELEGIADRTVQILQKAQAESDEVKRSEILRNGLDELNQRFGKLEARPSSWRLNRSSSRLHTAQKELGLDNWGRSKGFLGVPISSASEGQGRQGLGRPGWLEDSGACSRYRAV